MVLRVAVKHSGVHVDAEGNIPGRDAGSTLVRRLLRIFPGSQVIGPGVRHCNGFDLTPLEFVSDKETAVINMDVIDSVEVWRTLQSNSVDPKLMNFVWWSPSQYSQRVEREAIALSCGLFPTFANSEHTAKELSEIVNSGTTEEIASSCRIAWANLGIRLSHCQPRRNSKVPVVLYPAIYLTDRKRPRLFLEVIERVARRTAIQVEARLIESHLGKDLAVELANRKWAWVGPLTISRDSYWQALARTTAFLATSEEESYGLEYIEALVAGAIGIFPNLPWAKAILPERYPFFYDNAKQAEDLLFRAVTDPAACLRELDSIVGGNFNSWLSEHHDDRQFELAIAKQVSDWFPLGS